MIKSERVHCFTPLYKETIDDIIDKCLADFKNKVFKIMKEYEHKMNDLPMSTHMYDLFNVKGRLISYNSKNIEYEELKTDVKEKFLYCTDEMQNNIDEQDFKYWLNEEYISDKIAQSSSYTNLDALFGGGEFPYMNIKIVRIGNQKYSFYNLVR